MLIDKNIIIYVHIGTELPNYLSDSIFQLLNTIKKSPSFLGALKVSNNWEIVVILSDNLVNKLEQQISKFSKIYIDRELLQSIKIINSSELDKTDKENYISKYMSVFKKDFRDNFWNSTTTRFFYISNYISKYAKNNRHIIHLESDVLLYDISFINKLKLLDTKIVNSGSIYMVKDHDNRVVPSILIYEDMQAALNLSNHIIEFLFKGNSQFHNDMAILSKFYNIKKLDYDPRIIPIDDDVKYIFDGASIGQFVSGIDPRNIELNGSGIPPEIFNKIQELKVYDNPKIGFINEVFDIMKYYKVIFKNSEPFLIKNDKNGCGSDDDKFKIVNLHIHSKQLWSVNNIVNLKYQDIITGDRILEHCDITFTTPSTREFHRELSSYKNISFQVPLFFTKENALCIEDELNKIDILNRPIRIFIYTHYLDQFSEVLKRIKYDNPNGIDLYVHNSDHRASSNAIKILNSLNFIKKVYCQNTIIPIDQEESKFHILPIGQANRMWSHGDTLMLYKTIEQSYKNERQYNKNGSVYININKSTYKDREKLLNVINNSTYTWTISKNVNYENYLKELSNCYFCLCPRGNGIDTHRFWESLYLGVIPIVIIESIEDMNYYKCIEKLGIPFYKTNIDELSNTNPDIFGPELYKQYIEKYGPIQIMEQLKLDHYFNN